MEYGDLSSLAVEYPDYNSMGLVMQTVAANLSVKLVETKATKIQRTL
jgi:hypothetical protein